MTLRSQAAPLPRFLTRCAHAYAEGNTTLAESLFPHVHAEILPLVRRVIRQRTDKHHEDIEQEAILKIWRVLERGIEPDIQLVTYHSLVHMNRTAAGMGDAGRAGRARTGHVLEFSPIDAQEESTLSEPTDTLAEAIDTIDTCLIADTLSAVEAVWGVIALQLAEGQSQNQIAVTLGVSRWHVNKHVERMREYLEAQS